MPLLRCGTFARSLPDRELGSQDRRQRCPPFPLVINKFIRKPSSHDARTLDRPRPLRAPRPGGLLSTRSSTSTPLTQPWTTAPTGRIPTPRTRSVFARGAPAGRSGGGCGRGPRVYANAAVQRRRLRTVATHVGARSSSLPCFNHKYYEGSKEILTRLRADAEDPKAPPHACEPPPRCRRRLARHAAYAWRGGAVAHKIWGTCSPGPPWTPDKQAASRS